MGVGGAPVVDLSDLPVLHPSAASVSAQVSLTWSMRLESCSGVKKRLVCPSVTSIVRQ